MKKLLAVVLIAIWVYCGYLAYGYTLGGFTRSFPDLDNRAVARGAAIMGPASLLVAYVDFGTKDWLTKPYSKEQRWEAFHSKYPKLTREDFNLSR